MTPLIAYLFAPYDMLIIGIIVLLFFGNRLPTVMRSLGQGVTEFKRGLDEPPAKIDPPAQKSDAPTKLDDHVVPS